MPLDSEAAPSEEVAGIAAATVALVPPDELAVPLAAASTS